MKTLKSWLVGAVVLLFSISAFSQNEPVYNFFEIYYPGIQKSILIPKYCKTKVWMGEEKVKGLLKLVDENTISVDGREIKLKDITKIRYVNSERRFYGGLIGIPGAGLTYLGVDAIIKATQTDDPLKIALNVALAVCVLPGGAVMAVVGLPMMISGRKFKPKNGWELSIH